MARSSIQKSKKYLLAREFKGASVNIDEHMHGGAHSVGIGRKVVNGKATDEVAIRYYVDKKQTQSELSSKRAIPEKISYFSRIRNRQTVILTDIIESPRPEPEPDPKDRLRPVPGGASIGTPPPPGIIDVGTLGGWVWDLEDDSIVMLSNEHVLGSSSGVNIVQPGTLDGGSFPDDIIGQVKRGIPRSTSAVNTVDCSIGDPADEDIFESQIIDIAPAVYALEIAALDMEVEKFGRTTEHTFGIVTDVDLTTSLTSGHTFSDCIRVDVASPSLDWSAGGDSGSLVMSRQVIDADSGIKPAVGLHFAGASTYGIGCKIQNVFSALNLTTLCSGAFSAFLDSLFESEVTGEGLSAASFQRRANISAAVLNSTRLAPPAFFTRERSLIGSNRLFNGMSRDIQARLQESKKGRMINNFVDMHRDELLKLIIRNGDVRRATVDAFRPLLAGTTTTTDVLNRHLTEKDVSRLLKLSGQLQGKATSRKLKSSLKLIQAFGSKAAGKKVGDVINISKP